MQTQTVSHTAELLDRMYKNVKMGAQSIVTLMPKVKKDELREEMTSELARFEEYSAEIKKMLNKQGIEAKEENVVTRLSSKAGIMMNSMMDSTASHIAEMMMEGYTMGIADMTKDIREYENSKASEASLKLARDIVAFQEDCFSKMKSFL